MEMPRAFSSGRRSVSTPVSARTRAVLPWSMCPAVPRVSGAAIAALRLRGAQVALRVDPGGSVAERALVVGLILEGGRPEAAVQPGGGARAASDVDPQRPAAGTTADA